MAYDLRKLINVVYPEWRQDKYSIFEEAQLAQLNKLIKYSDYYDNDVFKHITVDYPEYKADGDRKPAQIPINYSRLIVDKLASWQFEIPVDISVTSEKKANIKKAADVEKDLYDIHKKNNLDLKHLQAAKECNTSGGVVYKLVYDKQLGVRVLVKPRMECFPITEVDDYEKLIRVHFVAFLDEQTIWKQTYELRSEKCYFIEATYDVQNIDKPKKIIAEGFLPIDFIPVYIIPNSPTIGMVFGYSELADLIPIINEIDKKYSDASDSLRFEMFAITILMNIKDFSRAGGKKGGKPKGKPGAVWNLITSGSGAGEPKADVFKLQSNFAYKDTLKDHLTNLKSALFELSGVVQLEADRLSGLGNLSGVALKLLYASMISKTNLKNTIWKPKLEQVYTDILKMKSAYEPYSYPEDINVEIIQHVPVPQNEVEKIDTAIKKLSAGLSSVKREMDLMGVEDPELLMAEILEEQKQSEQSDVYGVVNK